MIFPAKKAFRKFNAKRFFYLEKTNDGYANKKNQ